jgi:GNAT superfamily N-acetyltransferase
MSVTIRHANPNDAESIAELASELHAYLKGLGDETEFHFTASTYLRDGFGEEPAFLALVAEFDAVVVGYAILHLGYDTDYSRREAYLDDLFVREASRGHGVGRALMTCAADTARSHGAEVLWWGVYERNTSALRFYETLGAKYVSGLRFMSIDIERLRSGMG